MKYDPKKVIEMNPKVNLEDVIVSGLCSLLWFGESWCLVLVALSAMVQRKLVALSAMVQRKLVALSAMVQRKLVALSAMVQRKLVFSAGGPAEGHWDECLFVAYVWLCSARASLQ